MLKPFDVLGNGRFLAVSLGTQSSLYFISNYLSYKERLCIYKDIDSDRNISSLRNFYAQREKVLMLWKKPDFAGSVRLFR